jgi:multidrug efflux pump subunit AcrA (membrane-fusion protein)
MLKKIRIKMKRRTKIIIAVCSVVAIIVLISVFRPKPSAYDTAVVKRADVVQEVSVTGKVRAADNVSLAFERSGRIASIRAYSGSKVSAGELIMSLDNSELAAGLSQAEANLRSEEAKLSEIVRGSRPEEIEIQRTKVASASSSAAVAESGLDSAIDDAYAKADDALRNKADSLFLGARTSDPHLHFQVNNSKLDESIRKGRVSLESAMMGWNGDILASGSDIFTLSGESGSVMESLRSFLDELSLAVNDLTINSGFSQTTIDGWKSSVSSARSAVGLATSALQTAEGAYRTAASNLIIAEQQLALLISGSTAEEVISQESKVDGAKASISSIRAQIAKGEIRSPITGVIGRQDGRVGEITQGNSPVVSVISDKNFQIEANIPEADIAKVKAGDESMVTLDAYGSDTFFRARLISVDPGEAVIEGVTTYKAVFEFIDDDERIRSGMTANLDIMTARKDGVLVVPQRSVANEEGRKIVKVLKDKIVEEREVQVGLRGIGGVIEVIEGLAEGEEVITSLVK